MRQGLVQMGTDLNFNHFSGEPSASAAGRLGGGSNNPLTRQTSIYSLTFDELQNSIGASIKDFGSMNMDELLKNIWTADESQALTAAGGGLQRQGSLTVPRTMSHKTVDEIWKDMSSKDVAASGVGFPQKQPTLGEITLEEFLVRAGVVREDANTSQTANGVGFNADIMIRSNNNNTSAAAVAMSSGFGSFGFPHDPMTNNANNNNVMMMMMQSFNLPLNGGGSSHQPSLAASKQQPLFPLGLTGGAASVSPAQHLSDGLGKSNGDLSSLSPVPYIFNGGIRGRKANGTVEKVVERRQRRMIKNRESAARSRARKQAYTMELEAEVAKLKDESQELQKKQVEIMEMHKNQILEMMNNQAGTKRRRLRRTQTGPW